MPEWLLNFHTLKKSDELHFTRKSSYCFQRVLAIAILSVRPSHVWNCGSVKNGAS